jgi:signal transduction histidine kinase/DNA-binding response OmpR family regulator
MTEQSARPASVGELYGYLQQDTLALIAWALLGGCWLVAFIFYNPVQAMPARWLPALLVVCMGCLLALLLRERHYRLAAGILVSLLLLADGLIVLSLENGQLLYLAVPIISLASFLMGPRLAAAAAAGVLVLAGQAVSRGIPPSSLVPPLALALFTMAIAWLSSRHLYMTLEWAWESYARSLEKASEAQRHRAELARTSRSLEEAYHRVNWLNEALAKAWQAAEETKRFKTQFTANISHELRTPLYIIVGFAETMLFAPESYGKELPAPYRSDLMEIYGSSQHLLRLIDDLLDLSQIEAGRMGLVKEPADVVEVVHEAAGMLQTMIERKGLALEVRLPDEVLPTLRLDRTRIRQVLLNLLSNAARHTDRGRIMVEARVDREQVLIAVSDTGPGIPEEQLEKIFDAYYQADASPSGRRGGVGLGLAISRHFIEMHGGRIWAESHPGSGSRFSVALPLPKQPLERDCGPSQLLRTPPPSRPHADARQVLLIHPDPSVAGLLRRHLDDWQVLLADDAAAAEEQLRRARPKAIIAADSNQAAQLLQQANGQSPFELLRIPLIACPLPSGRLPALALGVQGYLVKPVARKALLSTLEQSAPQARRVLVVDDDPRVVRLLARILTSRSGRYQILRAYDGQEALALMRAERPDVVLLDLYMPELDGFSVLELMARDPLLTHMPVVVVSAKGLPEDGVVQLHGPITLQQPGGFALTEMFRYLQSLLDTSPPRSERGSASG